jgi:hypothetical protein
MIVIVFISKRWCGVTNYNNIPTDYISSWKWVEVSVKHHTSKRLQRKPPKNNNSKVPTILVPEKPKLTPQERVQS